MAKNGILDDMKQKGIEWMFIGSVDNLLVNYVDTLLLGLAIKKNVKIATRTIIKNSPYEKVGVLCKKKGKVKVIEYTEIPKKMRFAVDEHGEMIYGESHIMCNLYNIEALEKASTKELKYHVAEKRTNYMDESGEIVVPETENCYKFEKFIFDSFCLFDDIAILRGIREEDSCFTFNWFNQEGDLVLPTTERISLKHDVIKQADTIEELCDEFVVADKLGNKPIIDKILTANNVRLNVELLEDKNVYGAIWTEWGLKYVSKMNEKGELELI